MTVFPPHFYLEASLLKTHMAKYSFGMDDNQAEAYIMQSLSFALTTYKYAINATLLN